MACAPPSQRLHVCGRGERGAAALIRFQHHARDIAWLDIAFAYSALEPFKGIVGGTKPIRKRNLHEAWIQIPNPVLERRNSASLLRSQRASVKRFVVGDDHALAAAAGLCAITAAQLDGAFHRL